MHDQPTISDNRFCDRGFEKLLIALDHSLRAIDFQNPHFSDNVPEAVTQGGSELVKSYRHLKSSLWLAKRSLCTTIDREVSWLHELNAKDYYGTFIYALRHCHQNIHLNTITQQTKAAIATPAQSDEID